MATHLQGQIPKKKLPTLPIANISKGDLYTKGEFRRNFGHWLHQKMSKWIVQCTDEYIVKKAACTQSVSL